MDLKNIILAPTRRSWRWLLKLALMAVILSWLTIWVANNFIVVETRFISWSIETRLAWSLLATTGMGFLLGLVTGRLKR